MPRALWGSPGQEGEDHEARRPSTSLTRSGRTQLHRFSTERTLGHGSHLRSHLARRRLRLFHHRRLQPQHRRLASGQQHAHRDGLRRPRDGEVATRAPGSTTCVCIRTPGRNSPAFATARDLTRSGLAPPSDPLVIRSITPSLNPSTPSTRLSSCEGPGEGHGRRLTTSNCRPSLGCTGTTTSDCTAISTTFRQSSSRQSTMQPSAKPRWSNSQAESLHQTQCDSKSSIQSIRENHRILDSPGNSWMIAATNGDYPIGYRHSGIRRAHLSQVRIWFQLAMAKGTNCNFSSS